MKNGREKNLTRKKKHFSICVFFLLIFHTIVSSSAEFNDVSSGTIYYSFFFRLYCHCSYRMRSD